MRRRACVFGATVGLALGAAGCLNKQPNGPGGLGTLGRSDLPLGSPAGAAQQAAAKPGAKAVPEELSGKPAAALCIDMAERLERDGKEAEAVPYYERARQLDPALSERAGRRL